MKVILRSYSKKVEMTAIEILDPRSEEIEKLLAILNNYAMRLILGDYLKIEIERF